jgi:lipopolysaccharide biosynthesis glycosyltransferase
MKVYLGYDSREPRSYQVAENSLRANASIPVTVTPLNAQRLAEHGLLRRPTDTRGQRYDLPSNAPASTEFAISRFLVPFLAQTGWALFCDSDVVFRGDVAELVALADPRFAVQVVKHGKHNAPSTKMDGQVNLSYPRKNWSSVILWNVDHPANRRLSLVDVQERRGFDLHSFYWLADEEIGELPNRFNWLVDVELPPEEPVICHFTLGTPEVGVSSQHDHLWYAYETPPVRAA